MEAGLLFYLLAGKRESFGEILNAATLETDEVEMIGGVPFIAVVHVVKFQFFDQPVLLEEVQGIVDG